MPTAAAAVHEAPQYMRVSSLCTAAAAVQLLINKPFMLISIAYNKNIWHQMHVHKSLTSNYLFASSLTRSGAKSAI